MWWQDTPTNYSRMREVLDLDRARTNLGEYYHVFYLKSNPPKKYITYVVILS